MGIINQKLTIKHFFTIAKFQYRKKQITVEVNNFNGFRLSLACESSNIKFILHSEKAFVKVNKAFQKSG